jgi:anthranilate 1,2-dioxygenase large subunit
MAFALTGPARRTFMAAVSAGSAAVAISEGAARAAWPHTLTRVPYWVFQDAEVYAAERSAIFQGPTWNFLCLDSELPAPGSFRCTFVADAPVIVTRGQDGAIHGFENRCAHRGALISLEDRGCAKSFSCVYHGWTYNLEGDLTGVAFRRGIGGKGGMPADFRLEDHHPRKLRIATLHGLVFGTFSDETPPLEDYLGEEIAARIGRVLANRRPVVIGRYTQVLPANWKLYVENVKDSYHASILHLFFTTFQLNRLSMKGAIIVDGSGGHHVSYSAIDRSTKRGGEYAEQKLRSEGGYRLADPSILQGFAEFDDDITLQILSVFPTFVLQQIQNAIAVRQVVPRGPERADLHWTILGFENDTPAERLVRVKQANLVGPAGYISMEDGCVGGFIQRATAGAPDAMSVIEMGGHEAASSESRVTEASVRGFWKAYRNLMQL